jgi:hypothetical protein
MREVYELVTVAELEIGDRFVFVLASKPNIVQINRIEPSGTEDFTLHFDRNGYIKYPGYHPICRQLPPERNPDVLERALRNACHVIKHGIGVLRTQSGSFEEHITEAIRELESEAGR